MSIGNWTSRISIVRRMLRTGGLDKKECLHVFMMIPLQRSIYKRQLARQVGQHCLHNSDEVDCSDELVTSMFRCLCTAPKCFYIRLPSEIFSLSVLSSNVKISIRILKCPLHERRSSGGIACATTKTWIAAYDFISVANDDEGCRRNLATLNRLHLFIVHV